jgi:2-succinyl-5-enolpyruvyl-6-hydroxy-3-cyclohexene-1-carboxylate synthase
LTKRINVNRNIIWSDIFVAELSKLGVRNACISPGSRSTPLALAFARASGIKSYVHIDERSGSFFALGLAKNTRQPVVLVCTSGTAAAEFYPAIIESYQQKVPLIICTADRPPELLDCGANQTINQNNIYANHIRWFFDTGLPEMISDRVRHIRIIARRAVLEATGANSGPVHLNFPFRKPFEPDAYTDQIDERLIEAGNDARPLPPDIQKPVPSPEVIDSVAALLETNKRGLFVVGPGDYGSDFAPALSRLSKYVSYPVLADGASQLRFGKHDKTTFLSHYDAYLKTKKFTNGHAPDVIIQFGGTVSSKGLELFLNNQQAFKLHVNASGSWIDPANYLQNVIQSDPAVFCGRVEERLLKQMTAHDAAGWLDSFLSAEQSTVRIRREMIDCTETLFEGKALRVVVDEVPAGTPVMISNSMPIRDLDYFVGPSEKDIRIHTNRGASGIDGITSTALGIAATSNKPTVLITGDLAFYHDLNGLLASKKYDIPLIVVLINNNGGGIFELLPIAEYRDIFSPYFLTPHDLSFEPFVRAYGGQHRRITSWDEFRSGLRHAFEHPKLIVLELVTDAAESTVIRKKYWDEVEKVL